MSGHGFMMDDLERARGGDREAYGRLYDVHAPFVLSVCRRRGIDAEDATQEVFMIVWHKLDEIREGRFRAYLVGVAKRVCAQRRRAAARRSSYERAAVPHVVEAPAFEDMEALTEALERLDEDERLVVHLHYLEKRPVRAARELLGCSRSTYYATLSRAMARLEHHLSEALT
ncbi:MAG: sigma-70 family RNA polymerase sigma factor [Phycisphaerales bacterium]|nr:sigma-70 family RNA polymerase sigma factor [Phycisphaerales bacterium]